MNNWMAGLMKEELLSQNRIAFLVGKMTVEEYYLNITTIIRRLTNE